MNQKSIQAAAIGLLACVAAGSHGAGTPQESYQQALAATDAVQQWYTEGVPHTDRRGKVRLEYDAEQSFFPIAMWGIPRHQPEGEYDWRKLADLHINTVWPYADFTPPEEALDLAGQFGYQVIFMHQLPEESLRAIKDHPQLLGNVWMDEPIGNLEKPGKMEELFAQFTAYKNRAAELAPEMPVFINDAPWIMEPATEWFVRWNTAGDVACHDNYPVKISAANLASLAAPPNGIPFSTALTAIVNDQKKPVWLIVGAFEQGYPDVGNSDTFPYRYPTPEQLRAQVYTGLIHGATGIHYFIWDSFISRDGSVLGISPAPLETPDGFIADSPRAIRMNATQRANSRALWETVQSVNAELTELTPALLSPTIKPAQLSYSVTTKVFAGKSSVDNPIRTLLKPWPDAQGEYLLLTVNTEAAAVDATFHFDRKVEAAEAMFDSSQHPPKVEDKVVTLRYEPFAAHVLKLVIP